MVVHEIKYCQTPRHQDFHSNSTHNGYCVSIIYVALLPNNNSLTIDRVLFVQNTTVNNIASFHDQISNEIPKILDPWSFELKIYRANPIVSKLMSAVPPLQQLRQQPQQLQQLQQQTAQLNKILYTLSLSYNQNQTISIINKNCTIFNTSIDQGQSLMESNCSSGFYDPLDVILQSKLTSLWVLKQSLKGEGGNSYQVTLDNGDVQF